MIFNEWKKVLIIACFVVLTGYDICTTIAYRRAIHRCESLDRQYRECLEQLDAEQQYIGETVNGCLGIISESEGILRDAGSSIQDLRTGIRQIEENYRRMENILNSYNDSSD